MVRVIAAALLVLVPLAPAAHAERRAFGPLAVPALTVPLAAKNGIRPPVAAVQTRWQAARSRVRLRVGPVARVCAGGVVGVLRGAARLGGVLGRVAAGVSGVGSLALAAHAGWGVATARSGAARLEALGDLGQGMCGIARLGYFARPVVHSLGTVGAGLQCVAGACEIYDGLRKHDRSKVLLGSLDIGAGLLFGASALALANPYTLVAAIVVTGARFIYARRHGIASGWDRLCARFRERREHRAARRTAGAAAAACELAPAPAVDTTAAALALPVKAAGLGL